MLPEVQQLALEFMCRLLNNAPLLVEEMDIAVRGDFLVAAELWMERPRVKETFDMTKAMQMHAEALRPPPVNEPPTPEDQPASQTQDSQPTEVEVEESVQAEPCVPDPLEPEPAAVFDPACHFPHLHLTEMQKSILAKIDQEKLSDILERSRLRLRACDSVLAVFYPLWVFDVRFM